MYSIKVGQHLRPLLSAFAFLVPGTQAHAQTQGDHLIVGVGAQAVPTYQGSDDYRVLPVPAIDARYGRLFANLRDGVGIDTIESDHITIGGSVVWVRGYRQSDVPDGLDRIKNAAGARLFATVRTAGFVVTAGGTKALGGTKGVTVDASIGRPFLLSPRLVLLPGIVTTWANRRYTDGYFGIGAEEAALSGLPGYTAGSGFKDVSAGVLARYRLSPSLGVSANIGLTTLVGDAADSPLVAHRTRPTFGLGLTYRIAGPR